MLLFSYAVVQLVMIDRVLRFNVGENMLWAVTQANREAQRLLLGMARDDAPEALSLRYDILHSRVLLLTEGPQYSYFAMLGLEDQTHRITALLDRIGAMIDRDTPSDDATLQAAVAELDEALRLMSNDTVVAERMLRGEKHDLQRGAMQILLLAVLGAACSGAFMSGLLLRTLQQSIRAQRAHRALLEETVAQRTRELQDALASERRAKEVYRSFIVTVPHQFRTPLSVILMIAQRQLRRPDLDSQTLQRKFRRIVEAAQRLNRLLGGVMSVVTMDARELTRHRVDLNAVVGPALQQVREENPDREIRSDLSEAPLWIEADAVLLEQVVLNLLTNAVKYSGAESPVVLRTGRKGSGVFCSVTDYGVGIPDQAQATIFERFYRAPNVHHLPGMGVGLSLSRDIVTMHDGTIDFTSAEGQGSAFTITFPAREEGQ
ncbi:sensor histidine kinase [Paenirhodobacter sp.]|uniref:sensor histidine kinase n=1 Tax=Paenirhodobacter sp. TaxID=1965326 RepID=UPI003B3D3007